MKRKLPETAWRSKSSTLYKTLLTYNNLKIKKYYVYKKHTLKIFFHFSQIIIQYLNTFIYTNKEFITYDIMS